MAVERTGTEAAFIDVLSRVLDKSVVLDGWVRLAIAHRKTKLVATSVEVQQTYGERAQRDALTPDLPTDPGSSPDELGVREPRPNPKPPRSGAVAVHPYQ